MLDRGGERQCGEQMPQIAVGLDSCRLGGFDEAVETCAGGCSGLGAIRFDRKIFSPVDLLPRINRYRLIRLGDVRSRDSRINGDGQGGHFLAANLCVLDRPAPNSESNGKLTDAATAASGGTAGVYAGRCGIGPFLTGTPGRAPHRSCANDRLRCLTQRAPETSHDRLRQRVQPRGNYLPGAASCAFFGSFLLLLFFAS